MKSQLSVELRLQKHLVWLKGLNVTHSYDRHFLHQTNTETWFWLNLCQFVSFCATGEISYISYVSGVALTLWLHYYWLLQLRPNWANLYVSTQHASLWIGVSAQMSKMSMTVFWILMKDEHPSPKEAVPLFLNTATKGSIILILEIWLFESQSSLFPVRRNLYFSQDSLSLSGKFSCVLL